MAKARLNLEQEETNGIRVINVAGPLDSATHDQFKEFLDPLVAEERPRIVLDCTRLTYVNSRGITLLARYQRALSSSLAFFGVAALNSRVLKAIDLLGMGKLLRIYPTMKDALEAAEAL